MLAEVVDSERIKIVSWLEAEPGAILRHPSVICSVHHGGANSFLKPCRESCCISSIFLGFGLRYDTRVGIPQVPPVWFDLGLIAFELLT